MCFGWTKEFIHILHWFCYYFVDRLLVSDCQRVCFNSTNHLVKFASNMTTVSTRFVLRCRRATQRSAAGVHTVTLLRHGESLWNVEKRYTGWCDIPLTSNGEMDAHDAGVLMGERGMKFDIAFTSSLERAWRTCDIALGAAGQSEVKTWHLWCQGLLPRSWRTTRQHL